VIKEIDYQNNIQGSTLLKPIDYTDCFELKSNFTTIDNFARGYFLAQPTWLLLVNFGIFRREKLITTLRNITFQINENIGQWKVYGQDMRFMEYCFSFHQEDEKTLKVSTIVHYKGEIGKYYFTIVSLLHKPFVNLSLKNVLEAMHGK